MANIKQTILKKKIDNVIYDLMIKTTSTMVYVDDTTTLETKLSSMVTDISVAKAQLATLIGDGEAKAITAQIDEAVKAAVDAMNNESDAASLAGKIKAVTDAVNAINNETTGILAQSKTYTDEKIGISGTAFSTAKEYIDDKVSSVTSAIAGAFHFKGSVDYYDQLPTENVVEGDVYQIKYAGASGDAGTTLLNAEYAYNGTEFVELGSIVDLSAYSTTEQVTSAINTAKTEAITAADEKIAAAKTEINGSVATKARFIVSETEPADLTESDVWAQVVTA